MCFEDKRARHSLTVAKQMYKKTLEVTGDLVSARDMFHLGMVHDIGYHFTDCNTIHNEVGGEALRSEGYKYWQEVYWHGNPDAEYASPALSLLNWADLHTSADGEEVTFDERLQGIDDRYGVDSSEHKNAIRVMENLESVV